MCGHHRFGGGFNAGSQDARGNAEEHHCAQEQHEGQTAPVTQVSHTRKLGFFRPLKHRTQGPEHGHGANDQATPCGDNHQPRQRLPGSEEHGGLTGKIGEARQPTTGHKTHHQCGAIERHLAQQAAHAGHVEGARLGLKVATQGEAQASQERVGHHHQNGSGDTDDCEAGDAQECKAHVGQTRVADQEIHVLLTQGYPGAVQQITHSQDRDHRQPAMGSVRHQGYRHAKDRVETGLLKDARVHHGRGRGSGRIPDRGPRVEGKEPHQGGKAEDHQRENPGLGRDRQRMGCQMCLEHDDVQTVGAGGHIEGDQANQGGERAQGQVEGDFEGGPVAVLTATPHTDHDEGGNEGQFVEEVEEEQIQRRKGSHGPGDHRHEQHVKELHVAFDVPGYQHCSEAHETGD